MRGSSPRMTRELYAVRPRLCSAPLRKGYALRCVRGTEVHLAKPPRRSYKPGLIARTGEICMTIVFSQIAPSRPMRMSDVCLAL
jgi:hypothetical protein